MIGVIVKAAAVAASVGFGAGILAYRKAGKVKEEVKEKFSNVQTEIVRVDVPRGMDLNSARVVTKIFVPNFVDEDQLVLNDD